MFPRAVSADTAAERPMICIDAGHGGVDGGTDTATKPEKEYNLLLALYIRDALLESGEVDVVMTRDDDTYLKYLARAEIARDAQADLFLSVHCNQVKESYVNGTQAIVSLVGKCDASELASRLLDAIATVGIKRGRVETRPDTGSEDGIYYWNDGAQWDVPSKTPAGKISDYFSINTWCSKFGIPSIILEHGYLSNPGDLAVLNDDDSLRAIAAAEAETIISYFNDHEHIFSRSIDYPASCTLDGSVSERCTICSMKVGTTSLPANPDAHLWRLLEATPATCEADGEEKYVCQISFNLNDKGHECTVHEKTVPLPSAGHLFVTETTAGGTTRKCSVCGKVYGTSCTGGEHSYTAADASEPTCAERGATVYRCATCGDEYTDYTPALGHKYVATDELPSDAGSDGYIRYTCSVCGDEYTEVLAACDHIFTEDSLEPTCTRDGYIHKTCLLCSCPIEETIPATGHSLLTIERIEPTCKNDGRETGKCSVCGERVTSVLPALGHEYEQAFLGKVCKKCGERESVVRLQEIFSSNPVLAAAAAIAVLLVVGLIVIFAFVGRSQKRKKPRLHVHEPDDGADLDGLFSDSYEPREINKRSKK